MALTPPHAGPASAARGDRLALAIVLLAMLALWLPAAWTPFWGDDYYYLSGARLANDAGLPWLATFWPQEPLYFWRPLSQEAWWRVVDGALGGDVRLAHAALLLFHGLAAASVGLLAWSVARACAWTPAGGIAALAGALYGVLALHLLPLHWVAAANSPLLVLFSSLAMAAWLGAGRAAGAWRLALAAMVPLLLALALLAKESAVLTPVLMEVVPDGAATAEARQLVTQALEAVGLADVPGAYPWQLSGGMQQRVAIARALINEPPVLLADEPTGALDSKTGEEILALFKRLRDDGHTVVLITHDAEVAAHADRTFVMRDGELHEEAR